MATEQSVVMSFTRVDNLYEILIDREEITTSLFDGTSKNFRIVLVEACEDNIEENLNVDGTLNDDMVKYIHGEESSDGLCALSWDKGVNLNRVIRVADTMVSYTLGDASYLLKGAFLVVEGSGVVLAYSINNGVIPITKYFNVPVDGMIWTIQSKLNEG